MRTMGGRLLAASLALALMLAGACSGAGAPASPQAATGSPSPAASRGPAEPPSTAAPPTAPTEAASTALERITRTLTVSATGEGTVTPDGTTTHEDGVKVTLRASWSDATHEFSWGGDCSGATSPCVLTMDAAKSVTATFTALPAGRCAQPSDADCIRAVYRGAPGDYAQVVDIPADVLLEPDANGRYRVARGQQLTVVTAAPLPAGWTRFYLERSPLEFGTPSPVSASQLIAPVGTTYTFTPAADEAGSTLITFDLTAARPFVRPRPDGKPELGDVIVTTVFQVETDIFSYDSFDTTGAATAAGSYAFLMPDGTSTSVVTTYEELRDGTTTALIVNTTDAHGAHQADGFDAVEVGDLFEWHQADDCFVRYRVTEIAADPQGTAPRKQFGVEWMTYAFTGCSGAVPASAEATFDWRELPDLGGESLAAPVVHGIYQLVPAGWMGATRTKEVVRPPGYSSDNSVFTESLVEARTLPYWRDPDLPAGWRLDRAISGGLADPGYGYTAEYVAADGDAAFRLYGYHASVRYRPREASREIGAAPGVANGVLAEETRIVAGRPAYVIYSPAGPNHSPASLTWLWVYDEATESEYEIIGFDNSLLGAAIDNVTALAESLFE